MSAAAVGSALVVRHAENAAGRGGQQDEREGDQNGNGERAGRACRPAERVGRGGQPPANSLGPGHRFRGVSEIAATWRRVRASWPGLPPGLPQRLADTARQLAADTRLLAGTGQEKAPGMPASLARQMSALREDIAAARAVTHGPGAPAWATPGSGSPSARPCCPEDQDGHSERARGSCSRVRFLRCAGCRRGAGTLRPGLMHVPWRDPGRAGRRARQSGSVFAADGVAGERDEDMNARARPVTPGLTSALGAHPRRDRRHSMRLRASRAMPWLQSVICPAGTYPVSFLVP